VDRGLDGEKDAQAVLLETARYLGLGISNLLKGLSPEAIIVSGRIARAWPVIAEEIKNAVEKNSVCRGLPSPRIIASTLGENPNLMGALSLILAGKFAARLSG
jgi:predicted NBD/HSP70 family sugar kinase